MDSTRLSLLTQVGAGADPAWREFVDLYQPWVYTWLRRQGMSHHDAEELTQDVLAVLVRELPCFTHSGNKGAFRHWLRQVMSNRALGFWRARRFRNEATGESRFLRWAEQLADPSSGLSRIWDQEHDQHVLIQSLKRVEAELTATTSTAFRRLVIDGITAEQVAAELGISVGAVYSAKSRVLRKLRRAVAYFEQPNSGSDRGPVPP